MRCSRTQFIIGLILVSVLAALGYYRAMQPIMPFPAQEIDAHGSLLFYSTRGGVGGWYLMQPDGTNVGRLEFPKLGTYKINGLVWIAELGAFAASLVDTQGQEHLYLMDLQGNIQQRLTSDAFPAGDPTYSAMAGKFAFVCVDQDLDICLVNPDGSAPVNLTQYPSRDSSPCWSPSGKQILFVSNRNAVPGIWVVNADGTDLALLSNVQVPEGNPSWSPDGKKILFDTQRDGHWQVYIMDPDGENAVNLSKSASSDVEPRWSPDGRYIAFRSDRDGGHDIFVMKADGSEVLNLTRTPRYREMSFIWSMDSQQIIYAAETEVAAEIFRVNVDGTGLTNLTRSPAEDVDPQWIGP